MNKWIKKEKDWFISNKVYIVLLCVITSLFSLLYFNRFAPDTMGWQLYNSILMEDGKTVYKDFFNYLPPGSLIRTIWTYAITGGSIVGYRFICIVERVLLAFLIFKLLSRFYQAKYVWLATVAGMILTATTVVDQFGDYNQTYKLYLIIGIFFGIKFFESKGKIKKENLFIFLFGCSLGMVMLYKQSVGVLAPACFFLMLTLYCIIEKNRGFFRYTFFALLGYLIPVGLCAVWLSQMDALGPFIEQIFGSVAAKGDSTTLLFRFWKNIFQPDCLIIFLPFVVLFYVETMRRKQKIILNSRQCNCFRWAIITFEVLFIFQKFGQYVGQFVGATSWTNMYWLFLAVGAGCIYSFYKTKNVPEKFAEGKEYKTPFYICAIGIILFLGLYIITCFDGNTLSVLYGDSNFFAFKEDLPILSTYFIVGSLFMSFGYYIIKRKPLYSLEYMLMLLGFFIIVFEAGMATGTTGITYIIACVGIPFALCVLFEIKTPRNRIKNLILVMGCIFLCMLSLVQKYAQPYSWWGWADPAVSKEDNYSIDLPHMEGFRVAKETKITYEEINRLIVENSEPDDFVLTFPHMKLFNILSNRMTAPTFVVSYFFDVCPDEYAIRDARIIGKNPPKIVILNEYDEEFWNYNEKAFRNGAESGQREIMNWFNNSKTKYAQIGYINGLEIYCLLDNTPIEYTFFAYDGVKNIDVEPALDYSYSIVDVAMTQLGMNEYSFSHIKSVFFLITVFLCLFLLRNKRTNFYENVLFGVSTLGLFVRMQPLFSAVYILVLLFRSKYKTTQKERAWNVIIQILIWLQVLTIPITYLGDFPLLKYTRFCLSIILWVVALMQILTAGYEKSKTSFSEVAITLSCAAVFLASQVYFSETAWWDALICNNYFNNKDSLRLFGLLSFLMWAMFIYCIRIHKSKKQRG